MDRIIQLLEQLQKLISIFGVTGGFGFLVTLAGLALIGLEIKGRSASSVDEEGLHQDLLQALGTISLLEVNDEQRQRVAGLRFGLKAIGIRDNDDDFGFPSLFDLMERKFLAINTNLQGAPQPIEVRSDIEAIVKSKQYEFKPEGLRFFLVGLQGLTYLLEGQKGNTAASAVPMLTKAIEEMEKLKPRERAGLASLYNALGIARAISARESGKDNLQRIRLLADARLKFEDALRIASENNRGKEGTRHQTEKYRFLTNQVEWVIDILAPSIVDGEDLREEELGLLAKVVRQNPQSFHVHPPPSDIDETTVIGKLFDIGYASLSEARGLAPTVGVKRPAVNVAGFLFGVAWIAGKENDLLTKRHLQRSDEYPLVSIDQICQHLQQALDQFRYEWRSEKIVQTIRANPVVGLLGSPPEGSELNEVARCFRQQLGAFAGARQ